MLEIVRKINLSKTDLKCIDSDPLIAGGDEKVIFKGEEKIDFNSQISCLKNFDSGILFGLGNGSLGFFKDGEHKLYQIHTSKICALKVKNNKILTGSWDHSSCLLKKIETNGDYAINSLNYKLIKIPHPATPWCVDFLGENTLITGCADNIIRIFNDSNCIKTIEYHNNVVRGVFVDKNFIFSVDNYGVVMKYSKIGVLLKFRCLNEMSFGIYEYKDFLIVCGENGAVFVLDKNLKILDKIKLPCPTCWSITIEDDLLAVAGSDGHVYFLEYNEKIRKIDELENENKNINQSTKKLKDGEFVSDNVKYKRENGKIFIYQNNEWELIGYDEVTYDNSFTVELNGKNYTLSFNDSENVNDVAKRFLQENKLGLEFKSQIVDFVNKNFKQSKIYKKFEKIDLVGIKKVIGENKILEILEKIINDEKNNIIDIEEIERLLFNSEIPTFVILDICKYLYYKNIFIDISFIFNLNIEDKKVAKAFVWLMTNLVPESPINIAVLHRKLQSLKDSKLLTFDDLLYYDHNYNIKKNYK